MMGGSPRLRGNAGWQRFDSDLAKTGALMRAAGYALSESDPVSAYHHKDRQGRLRRVHATYDDGWRATLVLRLDGTSSLSFALKMILAKPE